jgi:O-succinylbenzoic acid--CoA ligase
MERGELAAYLPAFGAGAPGVARVIEEQDPAQFMASFASAVAGGGNIFLANPSWREQERTGLQRLFGNSAYGDEGWLMIPSGGARGGLKFARHDGWTIAASVAGFREHFGLETVNSVCVLPLHHVSGFMAWMRSALTGGAFVPWSWKSLESGHFPRELPQDCCISLVPTQLQRLLGSDAATEWLRGFRVIFVGGGATWETLADEAARLELPLSLTYGATETAAMVAAVRPEEFLNGMRGCGTALPHAQIEIVDDLVRVEGGSVFRGYFPSIKDERSWLTGDLGGFDANGSLVILGRSDDMIVTGGKKVAPDEVEAALRASGEFEDVAVIGVPDTEWGQSVVACYPGGRTPRPEVVEAALSGLESFKHPKRYAGIFPWPRNPQGKINHAELLRQAAAGPPPPIRR